MNTQLGAVLACRHREEEEGWGDNTDSGEMEAFVTYQRRRRRTDCTDAERPDEPETRPLNLKHQEEHCPVPSSIRHENHTGRHKQFFLDLGQADFSYSTCKICGLFYARGHGEDEKLHAMFHKGYLRGIQFKGWQKERLVVKHETNKERVILVLHSDPPQHQLKVKEVARIMEKELELDPGWLLHEQCKVYFYISLKKVVGCVVAESIKQAYPVLPEKVQVLESAKTEVPPKLIFLQMDKTETNLGPCQVKDDQSCMVEGCRMPSGDDDGSSIVEGCYLQGEEASPPLKPCNGFARASTCGARTLIFGDVKFQREIVHKRCKTRKDSAISGRPIVCSNLPVPAVCGVRGLWVSQTERRRGIATKLLDAVRTSFVYGGVVDSSQCAFSQPTLDGEAFAANYCKTDRFLVYS